MNFRWSDAVAENQIMPGNGSHKPPLHKSIASWHYLVTTLFTEFTATIPGGV